MKESEGDLKEWVARIPNQIDKNLSKHLNEINQAYENSRKSTEQLPYIIKEQNKKIIDDASKKIEMQVQELASIHENYKLKMKESEGDLKEWVTGVQIQIDKNSSNVNALSWQLNEIKGIYENTKQSIEQMLHIIDAQNKRITELTEIYKNRKFIVLSDINGKKLETTTLPRGAIGEFVIKGDVSVVTDGRNRNRSLAYAIAIGTGRWWINDKEYLYADKMTYKVGIYEKMEHRSVYPWGERVTFVTSVGVVEDKKIKARPVGDKNTLTQWRVPEYTPKQKVPYIIPNGTRILLALEEPIPVVVK
jgi:hypothetical protein